LIRFICSFFNTSCDGVPISVIYSRKYGTRAVVLCLASLPCLERSKTDHSPYDTVRVAICIRSDAMKNNKRVVTATVPRGGLASDEMEDNELIVTAAQ